MPLRGWLRKRFVEAKAEESKFNEEVKRFKIGDSQKIVVIPEEKDATKLDIKYPLIPPFAFARVFWDDKEKNLVYKVIEPSLNEEERKIYKRLSEGLAKVLELEIENLKTPEKLLRYIQKKINLVISEYGLTLKTGQYTRIMYYIYRDFVGLNELEPMMHDSYIEDIGIDGVGIPAYVIHKKYGSIKSNVKFTDKKELQEFVIKLSERCNRYVSYAEPLLDGTLPDGSRVQATLSSDVTTKGPTISIRKFREVPYSPTEMMKLGTASSDLLAYLWYALEHQSNMLITGATASGKTSFLNTIVAFIPPEDKIISIEDTKELNLSHENWIPALARIGFGTMTKEGVRYGEVTMFDLLKESFRQNPDYVIIGEVRGKEASVLFQGMASGHTSIGTVHGGSVEDIIKRMQTPPISLPPSLLESLDIVIVVTHAAQYGKSARRVKKISEIESIDIKGNSNTNDSFIWSPADDKYKKRQSVLLDKISKEFGIEREQIDKEIEDRKKFLEWLQRNEVFNFNLVSKHISMYYKNKEKVIKLMKKKIETKEEKNVE